MKKKNSKFIIIIFLVIFISIGYAFLTSNFEIRGISIIPKNTWNVHFANIVDDSFSSEVNNSASISSNGKNVNFEVTFNNPGEEYYFYVDVVNKGTLDAMLDLYEVTGLSDEQKNYIEWEITYSDGIKLTKYDKLPKNSKDTLKVLVKFKDNIDVSVLPDTNETINLTFKSIYVQADKSANERTTVEDKTAPDINFASNSSGTVKGNNQWYKSLSILSKLVDPSGISSAKYCVTTNDTCTPDQTTDIKNNSIAFQLTNNALGQTVCVEGIDTKDNNDVVCSKEKYYVDGEEPTITSVTSNSLDDTLSIRVEAKDKYSGVSKYYYSKDGGRTYISSKDNNYTFVGLEPDDYIVVNYVEDNAGNTSSTNTTTSTVRIRSWCEKNEITTLGNCAIAQGMNNKDVEGAKQEIEARGEPDFTVTSPTYIYTIKKSSNLTSISLANRSIYYATEYSFNEQTGKFTLNNPLSIELDSFKISENNEYYICANLSKEDFTIYKIVSISKDLEKYVINKYDYTNDYSYYDSKDSGIYSAQDDTGTSYYYRGSIGGNYVKFADLYWRIVRINGDGSIRLMYFGDNSKNGQNAFNSVFNNKYWDPTYIGYMYNDDEFSSEEIVSSEASFNNFNEYSTYHYGKSYQWNSSTKMFELKGSVEDGNIKTGIWKNDYKELIKDGYIYSCFDEQNPLSCPVLIKITGYGGITNTKGNYISHSSTTYENATKNNKPSELLTKLNDWYNKFIKNKFDENGTQYSEYIVDQIFCNDRSISEIADNGNGHDFSPTTYYSSYYRLNINKQPILTCPQKNDRFTVSESIGNGALSKYNPIGTITADEYVLAGGVYDKANQLFYMNYNDNCDFYTMTPAFFHSLSRAAHIMKISNNGVVVNYSTSNRGVRPVINLSKNVLVAGGDGTADNPYAVKLN